MTAMFELLAAPLPACPWNALNRVVLPQPGLPMIEMYTFRSLAFWEVYETKAYPKCIQKTRAGGRVTGYRCAGT
jgi:hypothetical protein